MMALPFTTKTRVSVNPWCERLASALPERCSTLRLALSMLMLILCAWVALPTAAHAAWFEAKGQATIIDGNRVAAKKQATQEAIKQALLFSGASVTSIQTLTNGLLQNDAFTVRSHGDVNSLELIDEVWHDDFVTVSIRADVFPQAQQCTTSHLNKKIVTSYFPIRRPEQALEGNVKGLSEAIPQRLQEAFNNLSDNVHLSHIAPYQIAWQNRQVLAQAPQLALDNDTQYVLAATIDDLSVQQGTSSTLKFWTNTSSQRYLSLNVKVIDGINGSTVMEKRYDTSAPWLYDRFKTIDTQSAVFWQSPFGKAMTDLFAQISNDVMETIACAPASAPILKVNNNDLLIAMGRSHGLRVGDELFVYQTDKNTGANGKSYLQYRIYPNKVVVTEAYVDTAMVQAVGTGILANIQSGDFVAFR